MIRSCGVILVLQNMRFGFYGHCSKEGKVTASIRYCFGISLFLRKMFFNWCTLKTYFSEFMISLKYPFLTLDFLREDTRVGTSFLRIAAHDDDYSSNAAISYSIANEEPNYLQINPTTGWVFVNQPISEVGRLLSFLNWVSQDVIGGTQVTGLCYLFTFKVNMSSLN